MLQSGEDSSLCSVLAVFSNSDWEQMCLQAMSGVDKVTVNLSTGIATVEVYASDPMDAAFNKMPPMVKRISQLGFKAQAHFEDW